MDNNFTKTKFRYKYLPFNEDSLKIISEGTIKFTDPEDFNDPFDCDPIYDIKYIPKYYHGLPKDKKRECISKASNIPIEKVADEMIDELKPSAGFGTDEYHNYHKKYYQKNPQELDNLITNISQIPPKDITDRIRQSALGEITGKYTQPNMGICSLSRVALNILMWAHYADCHTGFVVEFCIPTEIKQAQIPSHSDMLNFLSCRKVDYSEIRPVMDPSNTNRQDELKKFLLTKSKEWSYEQEERVLGLDIKPGIYPYARDIILKSVFAGVSMKDSDYQILKTTVDEVNNKAGLNVALHKVKKNESEFGLFVPKRNDL